MRKGWRKPEQEKWLKGNPEVREWIEELRIRSRNTAENRLYHLRYFFLWLKKEKGIKSVKQLLDHYKKLRKEGEEYVHNKWVKQYLLNDENKKKSLSWREGALASIRGFYRFNHCPLPNEKINLTVKDEDAQKLREKAWLKPMTLEDFRKLIEPAKIREKSILLTMLQSGMGVGELVNQFNVCTCTEEQIKKHGHICVSANVLRKLRQEKERIKVYPLIAFKRPSNDNRKLYFTFIGKDAVNLLKQYLVFRSDLVLRARKQLQELEENERKGHYLHKWEKERMKRLRERLQKITPECHEGEPIYITNLLNPIGEHNIQTAVRRLKKQTGLLDRDFTPHTCRDLFKTECDHAGVKDNISEYWIRHKLDRYGYNRLDQLYEQDFEREYDKVEPALNIISGALPKETAERVEKLEKELEKKTKMIESMRTQIKMLNLVYPFIMKNVMERLGPGEKEKLRELYEVIASKTA